VTAEPPVKPLRADAQRNRLRVLDAARKCFSEQGLDAQMDDIARIAEVGVGTVYRHFETKEALLRALADAHFDDAAASAERATQLADPWEAFVTFIRSGSDLLAESRALAQVSVDRPDLMAEAAFRADARLRLFDTTEGLIRRAQEAGALRADFQLEDIPAVFCGLAALHVSREGYVNWQRVLQFVLDGLRAPAASELPPVTRELPRQPRD
jgi:AcrR family transcriptional regulator